MKKLLLPIVFTLTSLLYPSELSSWYKQCMDKSGGVEIKMHICNGDELKR